MTSRERFLTTINGGEPDRPPVFATLTPQVAEKLSKHLGLPYEKPIDSLLSTRISHMDLLTHLGNDAVGIAAAAPNNAPTVTDEKGIMTNEWGMKFENAGLYNEFYDFPLKNAEGKEEIDKYPFPDPHAAGRYDPAQKTLDKYQKNFGVVADLETCIYETSWYLVGLEKFLFDMMMNPPYLNALLDKVTETNTAMGVELIKMGADVLWAGDDFGSQTGMLMDPEQWRSIFKPRIKEMFAEFRKVNPNIKIAWHSCGSILDIIPDFIEIGLDILNPLQPMATGMDPQYLKNEYGKDLDFFGAICVQDLLPNKSPQEIKDEVKRRIEILGKGGGYIVAPAHNIQDDTSVENVLAFYEAIKEF